MTTIHPVFTGIVNMVESLDNTHPCPSYPVLRERWWDDVAAFMNDTDTKIELEVDDAIIDPYIECIEDLFNLFAEKATSVGRGWAQQPVAERLEYARGLLDRRQTAQRSQAWYEQSRNVLTASEFSAILGTPRAVQALALKKSEPIVPMAQKHACYSCEMSPMDWGVRFEPVVKQILGKFWSAEIMDVGRLMHPTDSTLAASPDGLILAASISARIGRLIEIKCPVTRGINGKIPFDYWCQMQIQMEVTDIDECDYIEVKLVSGYKSDVYTPPEEGSLGKTYNGVVWLLQNNETLELKYAYTVEERDAFLGLETGWGVLEEIPWHFAAYFTETVHRDRSWFESTRPKQKAFWDTVNAARDGTLVIAPKEKKAKVDVCKITDD